MMMMMVMMMVVKELSHHTGSNNNNTSANDWPIALSHHLVDGLADGYVESVAVLEQIYRRPDGCLRGAVCNHPLCQRQKLVGHLVNLSVHLYINMRVCVS